MQWQSSDAVLGAGGHGSCNLAREAVDKGLAAAVVVGRDSTREGRADDRVPVENEEQPCRDEARQAKGARE